jgi:hypothetical protein
MPLPFLSFMYFIFTEQNTEAFYSILMLTSRLLKMKDVQGYKIRYLFVGRYLLSQE